ncbi:MAG: nucleotidyltransferase domain-containing protein [Deltaproteobacteria bacterium]|nr:nucleotidyltransferase domain-containing protein [Deltaproteobacteria bacterium]
MKGGGKLSSQDTGGFCVAQAKPEVKEIIEKYREQLLNLGIRAQRIYLYGSHAKGIAREGSDIDLVVVSSDFSSLNLRERLEVLGVAAARLLQPIQAAGYTPEEIAAKSYSPFLDEILAAEAVSV